jgi:hypothetical protein
LNRQYHEKVQLYEKMSEKTSDPNTSEYGRQESVRQLKHLGAELRSVIQELETKVGLALLSNMIGRANHCSSWNPFLSTDDLQNTNSKTESACCSIFKIRDWSFESTLAFIETFF